MPNEIKMWTCSICGSVYNNKETAEQCEAKGVYPGDQAILPSAFEFRHERIGIEVGHRYLAINRATSNVVPVTIESKYQSAYNKHETHYTAVKDNGQPLNLNGWYLVDLSGWDLLDKQRRGTSPVRLLRA